jgi:hypothetical protein
MAAPVEAIHGCFHPLRYRHGPNMPSLANQINDCPMLIPSLEMLNGQSNKLGSPQAAGQKQSEHGAISFSPNQVCIGSL